MRTSPISEEDVTECVDWPRGRMWEGVNRSSCFFFFPFFFSFFSFLLYVLQTLGASAHQSGLSSRFLFLPPSVQPPLTSGPYGGHTRASFDVARFPLSSRDASVDMPHPP